MGSHVGLYDQTRRAVLRCPQLPRDRIDVRGPLGHRNPLRVVDLTSTLADVVRTQLDYDRDLPVSYGFDLDGRVYRGLRGEQELRRRGAVVAWTPMFMSSHGKLGPWAKRAYAYWWAWATAAASEQLAEHGIIVTARETLDWRDWWDSPYARRLQDLEPFEAAS